MRRKNIKGFPLLLSNGDEREGKIMKRFNNIDVALYIFILTGLGYFITFLYGWGYNNYFLIPIHFIDLSILSITRSISLIMVSVAICLAYTIFFIDKTDLSSLFGGIRKSIFRSRYNFLFQLLCLIGTGSMIVLMERENVPQFQIFYIFMAIVFTSLYCYIKNYIKAVFVTSIAVLFMLPYIIGLVNAKNQTDFFIIDNHEEYIIITFNDDKIIAAKFDSENNTIFPEFKILPTNNLIEYNSNISLIEINNLIIAEPTEFKGE